MLAVLIAGFTSTADVTPATAIGVGPILRLTLLGSVPEDAAFNLYLQTDPPSIGQDSTNFCALSDYTRPCETGRTYEAATFGFEPGTVIVFRYLRWDGERNVPFYEGRVTLSAGEPNPTYNVTYDYSLGLPDTAARPAPSHWSPVAILAVLALPLVLLRIRRTAPGRS